MARLMTLSRAARLVGVTRVALQKKIADGALAAFEGMVSEESLLQAYPHVSLEDDSALERMAQTKAIAHYARAAERLPSKEVLAARLGALAKELSDARTEARRYRAVIDGLAERLQTWNGAGEDLQAAAASLEAWLHQALEKGGDPAGLRNLSIRDSFLRVMASHVKLLPSGREFFVEGTDTVLEAALRAGIALDYGCSGGSCGQCKARVVSGQLLPVRAHEYPLSDDDKAAGYALMCSNTAVSDLVLEAHEATAAADIPPQRVTAYVKALSPFDERMLLLHLRTPPDKRLRFLAGQDVVLHIGQSLSAQLPIAGCPCDDGNLPFHVPKKAGNYFADYVWSRLKAGDPVTVEGPSGDFVLRADASPRLIFIAFGVGFARVKGLIEHAMALDSAESMHLYWLVAQPGDHYFDNWPRALADALDNFGYTPLLSTANLETAGGDRRQLLDELIDQVVADHPDLARCDAYAAGPESLLDALAARLAERGLQPAHWRAGATE
ncbi:MAG TPA: 2Fe-2S iron-sulfur cluster-binding protein [Rhodocyclaceae bacterium]|nr:2Fe-2S iron-sulfur cluster-binding protein [Rhodocyclaceae bacterium]